MFIPHQKPIFEGTFLARYDRFIARVAIGTIEVDAHCVNTGRMEGLIKPGSKAWLSKVPDDSPRKLRYTLELLEVDGVMIGVNTQTPNHLADTIVRSRLVPGMKRFRTLRREVAYGERSRIDLLLEGRNRRHWVEVKNCHLVYPDGGAYFPDSQSLRATGHLVELAQKVSDGDKASVLFVVQRADADFVRPSYLHDPAFADAAVQAHKAGVGFFALGFAPDDQGFDFLGTLPVDLKAYEQGPLLKFKEALADSSGWKRRGKKESSAR